MRDLRWWAGYLALCGLLLAAALGVRSCTRSADESDCVASGGTLVDVSGGKGWFCLPPGR